MTQELATISPADLDREELVCLTEALAVENKELRDQLVVQKDTPGITWTRLKVHATMSMFVYSVVAAIDGDAFFAHPILATVLATLNLMLWTTISAAAQVGSAPAEQSSGATHTGPR